MTQVKLILGDQLHAGHSWFRKVDANVVFVMAELRQETDYVRHHRQKVLAFFAAMRRFADALRQAGHRLRYFTLDDSVAFTDLPDLLRHVLREENAAGFHWQLADEYRLDQQLRKFATTLDIPVAAVDSEHFLTPRDAWQHYPNSRLEYFYRALRKEYGVLLDSAGKPEGGQWNFDKENREALPDEVVWPEPLCFSENLSEIDAMLQRHGVETIGEVNADAVVWPLTRRQSRRLLDFFLQHCLVHFGRYQDAMTPAGWSLFHSRLSFSLNTKMLHPLEVIQAVEKAWRSNPQRIGLAQAEGFIRQILGWREYVRALYWQHMPGYRRGNHLGAKRALPAFYWTGDTRMACMAHSIGQSLEQAYAHHIQRLMVTGNFALLAGVHPDAVDDWYLGIYVDAIEWVELPNTRGMSQYADGGLIASKPYVSSGQYLRRMGAYCDNCHYQVAEKTGEGSCPFNSLYWHFLERHRDKLANNPRMKLIYANWARQPAAQRKAVLATASAYLAELDSL